MPDNTNGISLGSVMVSVSTESDVNKPSRIAGKSEGLIPKTRILINVGEKKKESLTLSVSESSSIQIQTRSFILPKFYLIRHTQKDS